MTSCQSVDGQVSHCTQVAVVDTRLRGVRGVELGEAEIVRGGVQTPVTAVRSAALGRQISSSRPPRPPPPLDLTVILLPGSRKILATFNPILAI